MVYNVLHYLHLKRFITRKNYRKFRRTDIKKKVHYYRKDYSSYNFNHLLLYSFYKDIIHTSYNQSYQFRLERDSSYVHIPDSKRLNCFDVYYFHYFIDIYETVSSRLIKNKYS